MLKKCLLAMVLCGCQSMAHAHQWRLAAADDKNSNPGFVRGAMISYTHEPPMWAWAAERAWLNKIQLGLGAHAATWHSDSNNKRSAKAKFDLHTAAITPTATIMLYQGKHIQPYATASIGPAYLSTIQFASSHLGSHVLFQDLVGIGTRLGPHWDASVNYLHYSNAGLASHNAGCDIHWLIGIGYRSTHTTTA